MHRRMRFTGQCMLAMLLFTANAGAATGDSSANSGESVSIAPPTTGPFEQKSIRRAGSAGPAAPGRTATGTSGNAWEMSKMPLALGAVLLLILALRAVGKKMVPGTKGGSGSRAVQVLLRSPVSPRQQLILVRVGRRLVLVGSSGAEMNPLCQIDDPDEVAEVLGQIQEDKSGSSVKNFRAMFGKAGNAYESPEPAVESPAISPEARETGEDLTGLTERVRRIAEQFQGS